MERKTVTKPIAFAGGLLLAASLAACGPRDSRLKKLTLGIPRDSVLNVMGGQRPQRIDAYLVNGHYIEALLFSPPGADSATTPERKLSPVVLVGGTLAGWGWSKWDSIAAANKIVLSK